MNYGLQLYSVRDTAQTDLRGALEQTAKLGYQTVEFAGFFGHSAGDVRAWLDTYGLQAIGTHTSLDALEQDFGSVVRYHQTIGCPLLVVPYAKPETQDECKALIDRLTEYQPKLAREGITLAYHNHAHEFEPIQGGASLWDALVSETSLPLELDTYWAYAAQKDPVAWMEALHADHRLPVIHIKDGLAGGSGKPLGLGTAPVGAVYRAAVRMNIPMLVESETLEPNGMDEASVCIGYLRKLEGMLSQ